MRPDMVSKECVHLIVAICLSITLSTPAHTDDNPDVKLSNSANCFTLSFYKQLAKTKGSLVSSPLSLDVLLSILRTGAGGKTADELTKGLGYDDLSVQDMQDSFHSKLQKLTGSDGNQLEVANSMWIQDQFKIKDSFKNNTTKNFFAEVENVNFAGDATDKINSWGKEKTHGLIPTLFDQPLDASTVMVLVNAIYFKGEWKTKFDKKETKDGDFKNNDSKDSPTKVKLMHLQTKLNYNFDSTLKSQILEMDYKGSDISMVIILPQDSSNVEALEGALTCDSFKSSLESVSSTLVDVTLPKFDLKSDFDLIAPIKGVGIKDIFKGSADFSGIAPNIAVSKAVQKAIIKVYEEGSEAAALTGIGMMAMAAAVDTEPRIEYFRADHPFLFLIRNKATNLVLFMGRVSELPNAS